MNVGDGEKLKEERKEEGKVKNKNEGCGIIGGRFFIGVNRVKEMLEKEEVLGYMKGLWGEGLEWICGLEWGVLNKKEEGWG